MNFIYGLITAIILAGSYYELKLQPHLNELQSTIDTQSIDIEQAKQQFATDKAQWARWQNQVDLLKSQVNGLQTALTQAKAKLTEEEAKTQPQAISAPNTTVAEQVAPAPTGFHQVESPDGTIRTYPNLPTAGELTHLPSTDPNTTVRTELITLKAKLQTTIGQHDSWHGNGDIPDNISQQAIQDIQRQITLDEQQLQ